MRPLTLEVDDCGIPSRKVKPYHNVVTEQKRDARCLVRKSWETSKRTLRSGLVNRADNDMLFCLFGLFTMFSL